MIYTQHGYRSRLDPKKYPYSNKLVNDSIKYCSNMTLLKWIELYFYIMIKRVRWHELPSSHVYWDIQVNKDRKKALKTLIEKYEICRSNPSQISYLFNKFTSPKDIVDKINWLKKDIENREKVIKWHHWLVS